MHFPCGGNPNAQAIHPTCARIRNPASADDSPSSFGRRKNVARRGTSRRKASSRAPTWQGRWAAQWQALQRSQAIPLPDRRPQSIEVLADGFRVGFSVGTVASAWVAPTFRLTVRSLCTALLEVVDHQLPTQFELKEAALSLGMRHLVGLSPALALGLAFLSLVFASFLVLHQEVGGDDATRHKLCERAHLAFRSGWQLGAVVRKHCSREVSHHEALGAQRDYFGIVHFGHAQGPLHGNQPRVAECPQAPSRGADHQRRCRDGLHRGDRDVLSNGRWKDKTHPSSNSYLEADSVAAIYGDDIIAEGEPEELNCFETEALGRGQSA